MNVRTHIAGIFASRFEVPIASPYALLQELPEELPASVEELASAVAEAMAEQYRVHIGADEASAYQRQLVDSFERDAPELLQRYKQAAPKIANLFEQHFTPKKKA